MIKKALAVLLALALLFGAAPLAFARSEIDGWLIYYENMDADRTAFTAVIVAPAAYTRVSDHPQVEVTCSADPAGNGVFTPSAEQIRFYWDGKTGDHLILKVECQICDGSFPGYSTKLAVLPGSVLDDAGNGNARIYFDDDTEYRPADGFAEIDVTSNLLQKDYSREDDTVAVGDTLRVEYSGLYPVEIYLNDERTAAFPGGEMQTFTCSVTSTGALTVAVRQGGEAKETRALTVITSREMYERNLRDGLITAGDIPTTEDLVDVGLPQGSIFIPLAKVVAFFVLLRDLLLRLFSFGRITE